MNALERAFARYNRRYFASKLPKKVKVRWNESDEECAYFDLDHTIYISTHLKGWKSLWNLALLHEMCHVAHPKAGHGPRWHREMRRLARIGAFDPWW